MPANLVYHLEQLSCLGADRVTHKNGTLLQHLQGTWSLLKDWQNSETVCLAGLYHSVYGTGGFEQQLVPLSERRIISALIGDKAEQLVYLFGACDRPVTHPRIGRETPLEFHDRFSAQDYPLEFTQWYAQCEILLANEIDLGLHQPAFYRKHLAYYDGLFSRFKPWLSEAGFNAHSTLSGHVSAQEDTGRM